MRFRVLGPMGVDGAQGPVVIAAQRQQIILMMMLVEANRPVPVDRLIEAVWDDSPPATAKGQVQICVSILRRMLSEAGLPDFITTAPSGYLSRIPEGELDLQVFDELTRNARKASGEGRYPEAEEDYRTALGLWQGNNLTTGNSRVLQAVEVRLLEQRVAVIEEWADVRLRLGLHDELIGELTELVAQRPLRERLRAKLMLALYRSGRQAEALEVYREGRQLLVEELGIEPGDELRRLEKAILSGASELDVSAPQSSPSPVQAMPAVATVPKLLPGDVSDFTGQVELVQQLSRHLLPDPETGPPSGVPTVTVSGKAGVGKTTLAVHLGHELADDFPDGQLFVKLNGLSSQPVTPAQALERFLRALGVPGNSMPAGMEERAEMYRQRVADRRVLVILDDAATEEQVRWLLPGSPSCSVIVTSRFRLTGLSGAVPVEVEVLDSEHAMKMFVKIVGSARVYAELSKSLELIALCGGLPIALRIAAARLAARPHWTVEQFVDRLVNESRRLDELVHGGLGVRAHLELTAEVLTEPARTLFRRLGMLETGDFPGWVAAPLLGIEAPDAEEVLEELIDAQFVDVERVGQGRRVRFRLHDLIRAYSRELLARDESPGSRMEALTRTLGSWLFLTEEAHRREYGGDHTLIHGDGARWKLPDRVVNRELVDPIDWYESERYGIIAAVRQAAGCGLDELCWDLALTAVTLFEARSYFDDWRTTHEIALAEAQRAGNRRGEAAMLHSLGTLRLFEQRFDDAGPRLEQAERMFAEIGDTHGHALVLRNLAFLDRIQGRLDAAEARCSQALSELRVVGDQIGEVHALSSLAQIHIDRGSWGTAEEKLTAAVALLDETDNRRVRAQVLCRLGDVHLARADHAAAEATFQQVIAAVRSYGDQVGEVYALHGLGTAVSRQGRGTEAEDHLLKAQAQAAYLGHRLMGARIGLTLGELFLDVKAWDRALDALTRALQTFGDLDMLRWRCTTLRAIGDAYAGLEQSDAARMAWREALALAGELEPAVAEKLTAELGARLVG
ncbi:BTAD domain-containing putative transcriptional regulator [Phytomonospora sp. NPDC050363]|uniref:AfsR/SARP family transcriptional regulator n=1 Tax=Phytomonospora sp. NPDC050363 TaxID=3155642 RepID=UPI00340EF724